VVPHGKARKDALAEVAPRLGVFEKYELANAVAEKLVLCATSTGVPLLDRECVCGSVTAQPGCTYNRVKRQITECGVGKVDPRSQLIARTPLVYATGYDGLAAAPMTTNIRSDETRPYQRVPSKETYVESETTNGTSVEMMLYLLRKGRRASIALRVDGDPPKPSSVYRLGLDGLTVSC
jgi:hypothetical protein